MRRVAAETGTPLIDLTARSAAIVQALGPTMAAHYAPGRPDVDLVAAALAGTTAAAPVPPVVPSPVPPPTATPPRTGTFATAFDYTHLNRDGADLFAGLVATELARVVPAMRPLLVP